MKNEKKKTVVYIFGQPGSGKSTLVKNFLTQFQKKGDVLQPFKHQTYDGDLYHLGWQIGSKCGTDTLPNTVVDNVLSWLPSLPNGSIVIGEGDRLANDKFFVNVRKQNINLILIWLQTPDNVASERRRIRSENEKTKLQNASWVKGRITKCKNLAQQQQDTIIIDGTIHVEEQVKQMNQCVFSTK